MSWIQWTFSSILLLGFLIALIGNWYIYILGLMTRFGFTKNQEGLSRIPFIGGVAGAIGIYLFPLSYINNWWWFAFIIDPGGLMLVIDLIIFHLNKKNKPKK